MPFPQRQSHRFHCRGVNLGASIDELGTGEYPTMLNVRALQQGGVTTRTGQTTNLTFTSPTHSIRTLNNVATNLTKDIIGTGINLYLDSMLLEAGFSGDPLSFIRFRPDQSTESWMYVADTNKLRKVNTAGTVKNMGIAPPAGPPIVELGSALYKTVSEFASASGWSMGTAIARDPGGVTITAILYDTPGSSGFCCLVPSGTGFAWLQPGMRMIFPSTSEVVTVLEVHNAITTSTIAAFITDDLSPTPAIATICLTTPTQGLDHNSIVFINDGVNSEYTRVISANVGPDGLYSFRCKVVNTYAVGTPVMGEVSVRCYTSTIFAPGASLQADALQFNSGTGSTVTSQLITLDLSQIAGRPVGPDDYMHISVNFDHPELLTYGRVYLDVDEFTNDFTQNYYQKEFRGSDLESAVGIASTNSTLTASLGAITNTQIEESATDYVTGDIYTAPDFGPGSNQSTSGLPDSVQLSTGNSQWSELTFNISDLQRVGTDTTRSLKNVAAIAIEVVTTAVVVCTLSSWCIGGTYGPDVTPGEPIGILYRYRYRDSTTGAKSIPGPAVRYDVFPLRQWVSVGCLVSPDPSCDTIDVERLDPALQGGTGPEWHFTGSVPNVVNIGSRAVYPDFNTPEYVSATQSLEINVIQPFVTLLPPINSTAQVSGTTVIVAGLLPPKLLQGTVILIGGIAYQIYATPTPLTGVTSTFLELTAGAGVFGNLSVQIASPAVYGQPLPLMFGPLEGPTASFVFGLGDPNNPGLLYWLNGNDPDSMDSKNFLEVTPPSEPLVSGVVWDTYVFVASRDRVFLIQPTFDQPNLFTAIQVRSNSGCQGRWLMAAGADGVYFGGRDGVYKCTPNSGADCVSRELWPLFTHEGKPGIVTNGYQPIQFAYNDQLRIADGDVHVLTGGIDWRYSLVWPDKEFQPPIERGWFPDRYPLPPLTIYLQELPPEGDSLPAPLLLQGVSTGIQQLGATTDNGVAIPGSITMPPLKPGNDMRGNNLYVDCVTDLEGPASIILFGNLNTILVQAATAISSTPRGQVITTIDQTGNLALYRDVSAGYLFNSGTTIYEYQPQFFTQPVTMINYTQQNTDHGIPGWKLTRWLRMGVICSGVTTLTINTSEGQTFTYTLQATGATSGLTTQDQNAIFLMKARMFGYDISGPPFVMFPNSCYIRMKKFGIDGAFQEVPVFAANS